MPFTVDFLDDGRVLEWETTTDGAVVTERQDYTPHFYVGARSADTDFDPDAVARRLDCHPSVVETAVVRRRPGFRREAERVCRVGVDHVDRVRSVARRARREGEGPLGDVACFDVDFTREFRYCLETGQTATPGSDLSTLSLSAPRTALDDDGLSEVVVDGERFTDSPQAILDGVSRALEAGDPDVLVCSSAELVPALSEMAARVGDDAFTLSRWPGVDYQCLAGASTFESYGRVGHSPARYNVPGRALIDESNTFFYSETNLAGVLDLVSRSNKPLQELAWASIGNVLTAIQIRAARDRGVLVPWHAWRHEFFKPMGTLHDADRGGFIFAPEVGVHEGVHELDFASLYPNIIRTRNVSPDTVRCDCHPDREDVPGLGYAVCPERGYLPEVLTPLIEDRADLKADIRAEEARADPDEARLAKLRGQSSALKWILVACFGYQGFSNAKFGRIECHEAINAYAREILLTAKQRLEAAGWRVVHGIVDSIWVTKAPGVEEHARRDIETVAAEITESVGIRLEHEARYDWVAFVPQRDGDAGALTKYFGRVAGEDTFKCRGIEARQRSTPPFVADCQRTWLRRLDAGGPEAVLDALSDAIDRLHAGRVDPERLCQRNRVSKPLEGYTQNTQNVAALKRAREQGLAVHPGQDIAYVVVDDERTSRERVALAHEEPDDYDAGYYETLLVRAAESVLSPLGWTRGDVRRELSDHDTTTLSAFVDGE